MTFEEWQATGVDRAQMSDEEAGAYEGRRGRAYEAGFIVADGGYWLVSLPQDERTFATWQKAERFLWTEWCRDEING